MRQPKRFDRRHRNVSFRMIAEAFRQAHEHEAERESNYRQLGRVWLAEISTYGRLAAQV